MADRIKGLTVVLGGDTTGLNKALAGTNKEIKSTQQQLKDVERLLKIDPSNTELLEQKQRLLAKAVGETGDKLKTLKEAERQAQAQFKKGKISQQQYDNLKREIIDTEQSLGKLEDSAQAAAKAVDKVDDDPVKDLKKAADKAGDALDDAGDEAADLGDLLTAGAVIEGVKGIADAVGDLAESTREYRQIMGTLDVSSEKAGYTAQETTQLYEQLFGVLGDPQAASTTLANLQALNVDQTRLQRLLKNAVGAWATYGDSIPIDGLGESINETVKTGQVTGTLADVLNWGTKEGTTFGVTLKNNIPFEKKTSKELAAMTDAQREAYEADKARYESIEEYNKSVEEAASAEDRFNIALSNCATESDRVNLVLRALSGQGLEKTGQAWEENNEGIIKANKAQKEFLDKTSQLSEKLEPASQAIADGKNQLLDLVLTLTDKIDMDAMAETIGTVFDAVTNGITWLVANWETVAPILAGIVGTWLTIKGMGIVESILNATSVVSGLTAAFPSLGGALSLLTNPIALVVGAIISLITWIAISGDQIQETLQKVDNFMQNVFAVDWTEIFGPVLGEPINALFANFKSIWDAVMRVFNGVIDFVRGVFTGDWSRAWQGVLDIFGGIWDGAVAIIKAPLNACIGLINGMIGSINWIIDKINQISWTNPFTGTVHGFDIGHIGTIPYLAKGGVFQGGSAIVGEAGPELVSMVNGKTVVQPLTHNQKTTNFGGINVVINAQPGQDVRQLAELVADEIQARVDADRRVFA